MHEVDLHGIVRCVAYCILQHMAQGWPRCSACTIREIDWGTMFGNNLRQETRMLLIRKRKRVRKEEEGILTGAAIGTGSIWLTRGVVGGA